MGWTGKVFPKVAIERSYDVEAVGEAREKVFGAEEQRTQQRQSLGAVRHSPEFGNSSL